MVEIWLDKSSYIKVRRPNLDPMQEAATTMKLKSSLWEITGLWKIYIIPGPDCPSLLLADLVEYNRFHATVLTWSCDEASSCSDTSPTSPPGDDDARTASSREEMVIVTSSTAELAEGDRQKVYAAKYGGQQRCTPHHSWQILASDPASALSEASRGLLFIFWIFSVCSATGGFLLSLNKSSF